jgi:hypothetical protein
MSVHPYLARNSARSSSYHAANLAACGEDEVGEFRTPMMELGRIFSNLRFPARFETELEEGTATVPVPSFAWQLFCIPASVLRLNRNDVLVTVPIQEIDAKLLELPAIKLVVNRPQNLALHH